MRTRILFGSLGAAAVLFTAAAAPAQERPPLRVCLQAANLPMSAAHPDRGIEVDLARAVAERLGREPVLVWRALEDGPLDGPLLDGRCDVAPGAVVDAGLARGGAVEGIALTRPYATVGYQLVRHADAAPVRRLAELGDARIGVETESVPIYTLKQRGHRVYAVDDYDAVLRAVADGRIRYGYLWGPLAAWLVRERDDVLLVDGFEVTEHWSFALALRADDPALRAALDGALEDLARSGEVARIFAEYGVPYMKPPEAATARGRSLP